MKGKKMLNKKASPPPVVSYDLVDDEFKEKTSPAHSGEKRQETPPMQPEKSKQSPVQYE